MTAVAHLNTKLRRCGLTVPRVAYRNQRRLYPEGWLERRRAQRSRRIGRPITSGHPRAAYWRERKRREAMERKAVGA